MMTDRAEVPEPSAIVVDNASELAAALSPENAGLRIPARAGSYATGAPLTVPSNNRLEIVGSPAGFARNNRRIDPAPGDEYFTNAVP